MATSAIYSQQEPISTQFWNTYSWLNPANSGMEYKQYYALKGRDQWIGTDRNPKTYWALADYKINVLHSGLGINYIYDRIGLNTANLFTLNYNYQIRIRKDHLIALGLAMRVHNLTIDGKDFIYYDIRYDPSIPAGRVNGTTFNIGWGAVYRYKKFRLGISATNVNEPSFEFRDNVSYKNYQHIYVMASDRISVGEKLELNPNILYRVVQKIFSKEANLLDLNMNVIWNKKYLLGLTLREFSGSDAQLAFTAGIQFFKKLKVNYSYDPSIIPSLPRNGSHEINLSLAFD